jgi:cyclophilin family peptidyl-prolyl cis-trans isomerase
MRTTTILIALTMLTTGLAGCTGDPDGGGNDEFDAEALQNLQDFINGTVQPEWNNDRGDSGHQWTLSLSDGQWLEIHSVYVLLVHHHDEDGGWCHYSTQPAIVVTEAGYMLSNGMSMMFGGNYTLCVEWSDGVCYNENRDAESVMVEWTIIYRIHEASGVGYYYTGAWEGIGPSEGNGTNSTEYDCSGYGESWGPGIAPMPSGCENPIVTLHVFYHNSSSGENIGGMIQIELFRNYAPAHVDSFLTHVENEAYDSTVFHRVIDGFMIQSGDIEGQNGYGGYAANWYGYCNGQADNSTVNNTECVQNDWTLPDELGNNLTHGPGTLAMAKTSNPNTGGSQFYIVPSDSTPYWLDGVHTIFGQVIYGMQYVNAISEVPTDSGDSPIEEVRLTYVTIDEE